MFLADRWSPMASSRSHVSKSFCNTKMQDIDAKARFKRKTKRTHRFIRVIKPIFINLALAFLDDGFEVLQTRLKCLGDLRE